MISENKSRIIFVDSESALLLNAVRDGDGYLC